MKTTLLYLFLLIAGGVSAQVINIPDANFKARLLNTSANFWYAKDVNGNYIAVDANSNGQIEQSEALQVYELIIYNNGTTGSIQSLDGIQYFLNLRKLECGNHALTSLDVSALTNLESLNCRANSLQTLNLTGLTNLKYLNFEFNKMTSFNSAGLTGLETIECHTNLLTSLTVSGSPNLKTLQCYNNQLTVLDVSALSQLSSLSCSKNQLASLNVAMNPQLSALYCANNTMSSLVLDDLQPLQGLDYSNNPLPNVNVSAYTGLVLLNCSYTGMTTLNLAGFTALTDLYCSGNLFTTLTTDDLGALSYMECKNSLLTHLDLSHSPHLNYIHITDNALLASINLHNGGIIIHPGECQFTNNPSLQFICVDEGEADELLQYFEWNQVVPPVMGTDCSFQPGGLYNSISGVLKYDFNANGCDANDAPAIYTKVKIVNGTQEKVRFTNSNGEYLAYVGTGDHDITVESENSLFMFSPSPASVNFPAWDGSAHVQDFCLTSNGVSPDVEIAIVPSIPAMPGFDASYKLILKNSGNQILSGTVTFTYDDTVLDFISAAPLQNSIAGGVVTWNYTDLLPFENRSIYVTLNVNAPTDTPAVNIDDQLDFTAQVTPVSGDLTPDNNSFELNQIVVGSFDPNNIICLQGETEAPEAIGDYLHYVINFENTGNAAATFVVVTQQIDDTMFDVKSLELLNSSHVVAATIEGNKVEFRFDNINLAGGAQGNIIFKMKTLQTLEEGDEVMNSAKIVFDHNFPIQTNNAVTLFKTVLGRENFTENNLVAVYPNPVKDNVTISADSNLQSIQLYDIQGRLLQTALENNNSTNFDMTNRSAGIYFLKITTEKGTKVEKLIKK